MILALPPAVAALVLSTFVLDSGELLETLLLGNAHGSPRFTFSDALGVVICVESSTSGVDFVRFAFRYETIGSLTEVKEERLVVLLRLSLWPLLPDEDMCNSGTKSKIGDSSCCGRSND